MLTRKRKGRTEGEQQFAQNEVNHRVSYQGKVLVGLQIVSPVIPARSPFGGVFKLFMIMI